MYLMENTGRKSSTSCNPTSKMQLPGISSDTPVTVNANLSLQWVIPVYYRQGTMATGLQITAIEGDCHW